MSLRAPRFWMRDAPPARLLAPLSALYGVCAACHMHMRARHSFRAPVPVICVGNLTLGGCGKTPVTMALAGRLAARGAAVHCLTRGHGGRLRGPHRVDEARDSAQEVGDEPLLLARIAPVWVSRNRTEGARCAVEAGAQIIIMDDGFQNPGLAKTLSLLVFDAGRGVGNGRLFPAGPLRERMADGMARTDAIILMGEGDFRPASAGRPLPVIRAHMVLDRATLPAPGARLFAFAGIGHPERFFHALGKAGMRVRQTRVFGDHARFSLRSLQAMLKTAQEGGMELVTTEKDYVRLPPDFAPHVRAIKARVRFEDECAMDALLDALSGAADPAPACASTGRYGALRFGRGSPKL